MGTIPFFIKSEIEPDEPLPSGFVSCLLKTGDSLMGLCPPEFELGIATPDRVWEWLSEKPLPAALTQATGDGGMTAVYSILWSIFDFESTRTCWIEAVYLYATLRPTREQIDEGGAPELPTGAGMGALAPLAYRKTEALDCLTADELPPDALPDAWICSPIIKPELLTNVGVVNA